MHPLKPQVDGQVICATLEKSLTYLVSLSLEGNCLRQRRQASLDQSVNLDSSDTPDAPSPTAVPATPSFEDEWP